MSRESEVIISTKYARAFINVFASTIDSAQLQKIEKFILFLQNQKEAFFYFKLPLIKDEIKREVFQKLFSQFEVDDSFMVLIDLLMKDKRISLLSLVMVSIIKLIKQSFGIMDFTITSSHELEEHELSEIKKFLERKTGKKIEYKTRIDKKLIAGLKVYSDSLGWEYTIYDQLKLLARE